MADNFTANPGSGGDTFRADDLAGVKVPGSKIVLGDEGIDDGFVSSLNPMPVSVDSLPLPADASTETTLASVLTALQATLTASITGSVEVTNDSGNALPISASALPLPTGAATQTTLAAVLSALQGTLTVATHAVTQSGTWNIGTVTTLPSLPAGTNLIGEVASGARTDAIYNGTTALTPKFAKIAASTSGNNTIVAAVSGKKIRVLALKLLSNGTVNAKWQTGASGTDLTGLSYFVANAGEVLPYNPAGWFETAAGALLNLNLSAAIAVGGHLTYVEV